MRPILCSLAVLVALRLQMFHCLEHLRIAKHSSTVVRLSIGAAQLSMQLAVCVVVLHRGVKRVGWRIDRVLKRQPFV